MSSAPDSSAVRTALWRALHVEADAAPHLIEDQIGLALAAPEAHWRDRPDMHPVGTRPYRIAIVARTRYVEDLIDADHYSQYVLLGAGLDTYVQRRASRKRAATDPADSKPLVVFEIDQPGPQTWKRERLEALGYDIPEWQRLVPVDFEADANWWIALREHGFDPHAKTLISSSGVSMYITKEATADALRLIASLDPGSSVVMTFMLPIELADPADRPGLEAAARGAEASGTPWISYYTPEEMETAARIAGLSDIRIVRTAELTEQYLTSRTDGGAASSGEAMLIART